MERAAGTQVVSCDVSTLLCWILQELKATLPDQEAHSQATWCQMEWCQQSRQRSKRWGFTSIQKSITHLQSHLARPRSKPLHAADVANCYASRAWTTLLQLMRAGPPQPKFDVVGTEAVPAYCKR